MPTKAGQIVVDVTAGTAKFVVDIDTAKAKLREFGSTATASSRQTVAAFRVLEGGMPIRTAALFANTMLGMGPIIAAAFPIVGAIAFGGMIGHIIGQVHDFFKDMEEGPRKITNAFRELNAPLRLTNDELLVANDRLQNDIAKLEGRRQNTLKLALDEARLAADKLADSLDKDLASLDKLLKEQALGGFKAWLTGQQGTGADTEELKRFSERMAAIDAEGNAAVHAAKNKEDAQKAQDTWNQKLLGALDAEIAKFKALATESERLQRIHSGKATPADSAAFLAQNPGVSPLWGIQNAVPDQARALAEQHGALQNLFGLRDRLALQSANTELTARKGALTAASENAGLERPVTDRMRMLDVQLAGVREKLKAIGQPEAAQTMAKAFAEAQKVIEELNRALEQHHIKLTDAQKAQISAKEQAIAQTIAEAEWKTHLESSETSITARIRSQQMLADAIGKGYEATKRANVETQLMQQLGARYNDQAWMQGHQQDVTGLRSRIGQEYNAQHAAQVAGAVDKLNNQIELEQKLATVQAEGVEAVRRATLEVRLAKMLEEGATGGQIKAERDLYDATRANVAAASLAQINEKATAQQRLATAISQGAEAQRRATLETKYSEMARAGGSPKEISAQRALDEAEHQARITQEALRTGMAYKDALESINQQVAALQKLRKEQGDTLEIEISLRNLENERLHTLAQQTLQLRTGQAGLKAFFIDMQADAKSAAEIVYENLHSALDRVSDQFGKLFTGQKTNFGDMFKSLGGDMVRESTKSAMQKGLGGLGKAFGIDIPTGKADGSSGSPFHVIMDNQGGGGLLGKGSGGLFGGGDQGGGIFSFLGKLFGGGGVGGGGGGVAGGEEAGFMAEGGDVDPGRAYWVGDAGEPELFRPRAAGTVTPMHKIGGGTYSYHIDARGAALGVENRVARSIEMAHNAAVSNSVRVNAERTKRTPERSHP